MGAFLEKPKTDIEKQEGELLDGNYAFACMQGWRTEMEDAHHVRIGMEGELVKWSFFGIFDGHAGREVAVYSANNILNEILKTPEFEALKKDASLHTDQDLIRKGIKDGFLNYDKILQTTIQDNSGSTATVAFITPTHIILANCGDSRSIIICNDECIESTSDHKPSLEKEKARIVDAGAQVLIGRINGSLAVSRSLGDFDYKKNKNRKDVDQIVSAEPDVTFYPHDPKKDQALILACDGIWDVFENEDLAKFFLYQIKCNDSLAEVCSNILFTSLSKGSKDNMSIMTVKFNCAPMVDPEMKRLDEELNKKLENFVQDYCQKNDLTVLVEILKEIEMAEFDNYPPGGILAKRHLIEKYYNESGTQFSKNPNSE